MAATKSLPTTIECPGCKNQLPAWASQCQFCGSPLKAVPRPADAFKYDSTPTKSWQDVTHTILCLLWIGFGALYLLMAFEVIPSQAVKLGGDAYIGIVGSAMLAMGIGLILQQEWMEFLAKMVCYLLLAVTAFGFMQDLLFKSAGTKIPPLAFVISGVTMLIAGMQIYILNQVSDV